MHSVSASWAEPAGAVLGWQGRYATTSAQAIYVHIPFCVQKCSYCDFASWATRAEDPLVFAYICAVQHLIDAARAAGVVDGCQSAYIGGGTPSLAGEKIGWLCETLSRTGELRELTCEANPESVDASFVEALVANGATRVSMGMQSLQDREVKRLGRAHNSEGALQAAQLLLAAPLQVSFDLMCGIPLQTTSSWQSTLDEAIALAPDHMSVYPLMVEPNTPLAARVEQGLEQDVDPDAQADFMQQANKSLVLAGYSRYEVASYAREGAICQHNLAYWRAVPYLGVGTSAAGMLTRAGWQRLRCIAPQLAAPPEAAARIRYRIESDRLDIARDRGWESLDIHAEALTLEQAVAEDLMLAVRTQAGASSAQLAFAAEVLGDDALGCAVQKACDLGLASLDEQGALVPSESGWLLGNELYELLLDLAPMQVMQM